MEIRLRHWLLALLFSVLVHGCLMAWSPEWPKAARTSSPEKAEAALEGPKEAPASVRVLLSERVPEIVPVGIAMASPLRSEETPLGVSEGLLLPQEKDLPLSTLPIKESTPVKPSKPQAAETRDVHRVRGLFPESLETPLPLAEGLLPASSARRPLAPKTLFAEDRVIPKVAASKTTGPPVKPRSSLREGAELSPLRSEGVKSPLADAPREGEAVVVPGVPQLVSEASLQESASAPQQEVAPLVSEEVRAKTPKRAAIEPPVIASKPVPDPREQKAVLTNYFSQLKTRLERYRRYPRLAQQRRQEGTVLLRFVVNRKGEIVSSRIVKPSGHQLLDQEVQRMLQQASPLPPLPPEILQPRLELVVPISFRLQ